MLPTSENSTMKQKRKGELCSTTRVTRDPHLAQDGRHKVVVVVFVCTVRLVEVLDQLECLFAVLASTR